MKSSQVLQTPAFVHQVSSESMELAQLVQRIHNTLHPAKIVFQFALLIKYFLLQTPAFVHQVSSESMELAQLVQ
jgi:signal peptidase I